MENGLNEIEDLKTKEMELLLKIDLLKEEIKVLENELNIDSNNNNNILNKENIKYEEIFNQNVLSYYILL